MRVPLVFPDTTVLINFALCDQMELLAELVNGRASWTASVATECNDQAQDWDLPKMLDAHTIFGTPLVPNGTKEHLEITGHQAYFRQPGDGPRKHLGESETLAIIDCRRIESVFVTDDRKVPDRAVSHNVQVHCITTWDLVRLAVRTKKCTTQTAMSMREVLMGQQRVHLQHVRDPGRFVRWLLEDS
ncbi:hypothetical protein BJF80_14600 [Serinicoccus sp. CUA-874]|nr:hypothetical protein BJF80_14600 [Serinicoccus sp. CUA-874]